MLKLGIINDISDARNNARQRINENLVSRAKLRSSFLIELISATVVCSLGLIINSTAVIIGGMIIAPLMWPILRVSFHLASRRTRTSFEAWFNLLFSIGVILLVSALVALITPYKEVTSEMLLRTSPTSLEIFIALAAALIAALALALPKISDSVAGVAVATSLVPPLAVSGIGLAYLNFDIFYGAFLLFMTNALVIVLVATIVFSYFLYGKDFHNLRRKELIAIVVGLLAISIPLYRGLEHSILDISTSASAKSIIEERIDQYAPNAELENYQVTLSEDNQSIAIRAVVLLSPSQTISFEQEQELTRLLREKLGKEVDLRLVRQDSIRPVTEKELAEINQRSLVETIFKQSLEIIEPAAQINSFSAELSSDNIWGVEASLRVPDQASLSIDKLRQIEDAIREEIGQQVVITLEVINSKLIGGEELRRDDLSKTIRTILEDRSEFIEIISLNLEGLDQVNQLKVRAVVLVEPESELDTNLKTELIRSIQRQIGQDIQLEITLVESSNRL